MCKNARNFCMHYADHVYLIWNPNLSAKFRKKGLLLSLQMVEKNDRDRVLKMYHFLKSPRKVSKNLAKERFSVCSKTVNNIINVEEKTGRKKSSNTKKRKISFCWIFFRGFVNYWYQHLNFTFWTQTNFELEKPSTTSQKNFHTGFRAQKDRYAES